MLFRLKNSPVLVFCCCAFLLAACGGKQSQPVSLEIEKAPAPKYVDNELTGSELAALTSTSQIDRAVPDHAMADVAAQYKHFLRKGRGTMCAFSKRSEQYLAYARKVFKDRGMPEELANLAIVESGYRPDAVSRAGAAGAWQFMPETGARYGLAQDWWQDERLDPYKATEAAADYLQKLYNDFGDWPTAIAAYNAGEGKISRAKEGTGGKDFFEVNAKNHLLDEKAQLRTETRQYVPRFMAVTKIMRNLPKLGFEPIAPESSPEVLRLTARPGTDLREFSRACNLEWGEFSKMNQHHKRAITCTDRETFVYVPMRVKASAQKYLCTTDKASYAGWRPVRVANGKDSLEKISKRANIPLAKLQAANPGVGRLYAGQTIIAPLGVKLAPQSITAINKVVAAKAAPAKGAAHTLKSGETLFSVAKKYNIGVDALKAYNGLSDASKVRAGTPLSIPGARAAVPIKGGSSGRIGASKKKATYTVKAKDSLWSIAKRYNVSVDDLRKWNKSTATALRPGSTLVVAEE